MLVPNAEREAMRSQKPMIRSMTPPKKMPNTWRTNLPRKERKRFKNKLPPKTLNQHLLPLNQPSQRKTSHLKLRNSASNGLMVATTSQERSGMTNWLLSVLRKHAKLLKNNTVKRGKISQKSHLSDARLGLTSVRVVKLTLKHGNGSARLLHQQLALIPPWLSPALS